MNDLIFRITPNIVLGSYTITRLGQQVQEFGTRFMVIVDPVLNEVKIQDKVLQTLNDRNIDCFIFNELSEGANSKTAQRALALAKQGHVHGVIAVGGAKALNLGRTVAAFYNEVHDIYTFVDGASPTTNPLPCICVPTTFRTPFVFSNEVPLTDSRCHQLKLLKVQNNLTKLVIMDPNLMLTLTDNQKATISIDVMNMGIEAYLSQKANFFSDMFVEKGLELLSYAMDGSPSLDITTPSEILLAQAGAMTSIAAASSSLGLCSLISLGINARFRINKSLVASILIAYAVDEGAKFKGAQIEKLAHIMRSIPEDLTGEDAAKAFADNIRQRIAKENLPCRLKDLQLSMDDLALVVEDISQLDIVNRLPRSTSTDELFEFVKAAY